ncbi:universal stress protein [Paraglaciecola sp. 25GB23A]|uniref:universal stress protein n=1 Tax=Paraglaciecola sp. 25GB23A TaxID=3156068 RepID=UPI0032AEF8CC
MTTFKHAFIVIKDQHQELAPLVRAAECLGKVLSSITIYRHTELINPKNTEAWSEWQSTEIASFKAVLAKFDLLPTLDFIFTAKSFTPQEFEQSLEKSQADVVFRLNSGQRFLDGVFGSSFDQYFIADCSLPVWIVKPRRWDDSIEVLACLDVDDRSEINHKLNKDILQTSEQLGKHLKGQLHVVDCFWGEVGSMSFEVDNSGRFKQSTSVQVQHKDLIQSYIAEYALTQQSLHIIAGTPDFAIPDTASRLNAELVVIGNNADQGIMDRLFGDTAVNLVNNVDCDVLVLKP